MAVDDDLAYPEFVRQQMEYRASLHELHVSLVYQQPNPEGKAQNSWQQSHTECKGLELSFGTLGASESRAVNLRQAPFE